MEAATMRLWNRKQPSYDAIFEAPSYSKFMNL